MSRPMPRVKRKMLSTDEGYQRNFEAFVGNFTAKIAASKLGKTERTVRNKTNVSVDSSMCNLKPFKSCWMQFGFEILLLPCCYRAATGINSSRFGQFESEFEKSISVVADGFFRL
jgi:hypothetical protein